MQIALRLATRAYGETSPNPMVGAVLVRNGKIIGKGWHRRAGLPHAEIEAIRNAEKRGHKIKGATLYVTLEPCCTHGRTPPCTDAIIAAGIKRVVIGATDPNPQHCGKGLKILRKAGIEVVRGVEAKRAERLNEAFNHWIVQRTPFVTLKSAMTLDGKIATVSGESKWITSQKSRAFAMQLRQAVDAILVGVNTVIADDPKLTIRTGLKSKAQSPKLLRRIILDPTARTPLSAAVICDEHAERTTIVVSKLAPKNRVDALKRRVRILEAPLRRLRNSNHKSQIDLRWLLKKMGSENVTSLLVEGGGETNALFLSQRLVHRVAFFYAPKIFGGREARKAVAGEGIRKIEESVSLCNYQWERIGADLLLTARVGVQALACASSDSDET